MDFPVHVADLAATRRRLHQALKALISQQDLQRSASAR